MQTWGPQGVTQELPTFRLTDWQLKLFLTTLKFFTSINFYKSISALPNKWFNLYTCPPQLLKQCGEIQMRLWEITKYISITLIHFGIVTISETISFTTTRPVIRLQNLKTKLCITLNLLQQSIIWLFEYMILHKVTIFP